MSFLRDSYANQLAGVATRGGEFGPHYDRGVLFVVNQVQTTGKFDTSRFKLLSAGLRQGRILTPDERAEVTALLSELGLTPQQGAEFAEGIRQAESILGPYCK